MASKTRHLRRSSAWSSLRSLMRVPVFNALKKSSMVHRSTCQRMAVFAVSTRLPASASGRLSALAPARPSVVGNSQCRAFFLLGISVADTASMRTGGWPAAAPTSLRWCGCRCALCASCGCACPHKRPAPASVSPIAAARQGDPRDPFRSTFQDHLPLRRTAGAHQQLGAIGCRLAQQFPEIILSIADIDHPRSGTGGGKRRRLVKAAQPAGALLVVDLRAGFHAVDGFAAAERRVQFKQTQRASGQGALKSGMGDNAGGSRARDSIQNAAARITESIGGNLMKAGQSMSAPSTYISEEIHSTVDRTDAVG